MTRFALLLSATLLATPTLAQDATFDVEAADPAVEAELTETESELREFFEEREAATIAPTYNAAPSLSTQDASNLLDRADQEATEFNDIDDDDLAELDRARALGLEPRLEKPGQVEKDFPVACPLGTEAVADGSCLAGADFRFEN
ncbi:MAG: hypothetical protein WBF53_14570 [Litorimonas sp.]